MATTNLGRIGIVAKGIWSAGTYKRLDIVRYGSASYICTAATTTTQEPPNTDWSMISQDGDDGADGDMTNPMTAAGDMIIGGTSGAPTRLAKGTDGQVCTMVSGLPAWVNTSTSGNSDWLVATLVVDNTTTDTLDFVGLSIIAAGAYIIDFTLPPTTFNAQTKVYIGYNTDNPRTTTDYKTIVFYASPAHGAGVDTSMSGQSVFCHVDPGVSYAATTAHIYNLGGQLNCNNSGVNGLDGVALRNWASKKNTTVADLTAIKLQITAGVYFPVGTTARLYKRIQ